MDGSDDAGSAAGGIKAAGGTEGWSAVSRPGSSRGSIGADGAAPAEKASAAGGAAAAVKRLPEKRLSPTASYWVPLAAGGSPNEPPKRLSATRAAGADTDSAWIDADAMPPAGDSNEGAAPGADGGDEGSVAYGPA